MTKIEAFINHSPPVEKNRPRSRSCSREPFGSKEQTRWAEDEIRESSYREYHYDHEVNRPGLKRFKENKPIANLSEPPIEKS